MSVAIFSLQAFARHDAPLATAVHSKRIPIGAFQYFDEWGKLMERMATWLV